MGPPATGVRAIEIDDDISLYHPDTGAAVVLNGTASDVWRLADGAHGIDDITRLLATTYGVEPAAIRDDIARVIAELIEHGFLPA